jgi:hypothetical protein
MSLIGKRKSKSKLLGEPKIEVVPEGSANAGTPGTPSSGTSVSDDYGKLFLALLPYTEKITEFGRLRLA